MKNEVQTQAAAQMNLENGMLRMLREMSQTEQDEYRMVPLV